MDGQNSITVYDRTHSVEEWALLLDLTPDLLRLYTQKHGLTIPELFFLRRMKYDPKMLPKEAGRRKRRETETMKETVGLVRAILEKSGYTDTRLLDRVEVALCDKGRHTVAVDGSLFGYYYYNAHRLKMFNGEGAYTNTADYGRIIVTQDDAGDWVFHPDMDKTLISWRASRRRRT